MNPSFVYFGSGPVAEKSLKLLIPHFAIEAIVTKPSTADNMRRLSPGVQVYQITNRLELDKLMATRPFMSNTGILIDFGVIVSQSTIDSFSRGIINSHFSLLPQWRGADPITFAILSGQSKTGVSLMLLVEAMDEGPLLAQATCSIAPDATTPALTDQLIVLSASLLKRTVPDYIAGTLTPFQQKDGSLLEDKTPTYSRRLTKEDGAIDWSKPASQVEREIRAFANWPKSYTTIAGKNVIITRARTNIMSGRTGQIISDDKRLVVCCSDGSVEVLNIKPEGKREMSAQAFLAGYKNLLREAA